MSWISSTCRTRTRTLISTFTLSARNVIHAGDVFFNGFYPFIDASTGGTINGMIRGADACLAVADDKTKIVPGHGPLGDKDALQKYRDMLAAIATSVEKLKSGGQSLDQVIAAKPTADFDAVWGKGMLKPEQFVEIGLQHAVTC